MIDTIKVLPIKMKKLHKDAVIPQYAHPTDAALDLVAVSVSETVDYIEYHTGIAMEIPHGYVGLLYPRSSISKKSLTLANSVGVVDSGYRGEISFRFKKTDASTYLYVIGDKISSQFYAIGDRIGQIIIMPYPQIEFVETTVLSDSNRGIGGYGSTGS